MSRKSGHRFSGKDMRQRKKTAALREALSCGYLRHLWRGFGTYSPGSRAVRRLRSPGSLAPPGPALVGSMMRLRQTLLVVAVACCASAPAAAETVAEFYKGKTVALVVGHETGSGY